jgi:hypothetical protein
MPVSEYTKLCEYSEALEENWGKPPGNLNAAGNDLLIYGKQFGNVFIGVQPTFGYEGDPMRLLFSRSASPHHGFAAYYTFLEKVRRRWADCPGLPGTDASDVCAGDCRPHALLAALQQPRSPVPLTPPRCLLLPPPSPAPPRCSRPTPCCTLAPTAPSSSCPASRLACRACATPTP